LASYLIAGIFGFGLASQALAQGPHRTRSASQQRFPFFADRNRRGGEEGLRKVELTAATDAENQRLWRRQ